MSSELSTSTTTVMGAMLRHRFVTLALIALGIIGGLAYVVERPPEPSAKVLIVVHDPNYAGADGSVDARYASDQVNLLHGFGVAQAASQILATQKPAVALSAKQIMAALSVSNPGSDNTMTVQVRAKTGAVASAAASAVVAAYESSVAQAQHAQTAAQVFGINQALAGLATQAATATRNNQGAAFAQVQLAESQLLAQRAQLLASDSNPTPGVAGVTPPAVTAGSRLTAALKDGGFGLVLGLLVAALITYLMANRRRRMYDPTDPQRTSGIPLLSSIGYGRGSDERVAIAMTAAALESRCRQFGTRVVGVVNIGPSGAGGLAARIQDGYRALGRSCLVIDVERDIRQLSGLENYNVVLVEVPDVHVAEWAMRALASLDTAIIVVSRRTRSKYMREAVNLLESLGVRAAGYVFVKKPRWHLPRRQRAVALQRAAAEVRADAAA